MGTLAIYLAHQFKDMKSRGWSCRTEGDLLSRRVADRFGFRPHADVMLERDGRKVAVEFEIRRTDPVANQVKFFLAYKAGTISRDDMLVSMFSPGIDRGRRCIASVFTRELRREGIPAFQVVLLPRMNPSEISALNEADNAGLDRAALPIKEEFARLLSVVEPEAEREHRIHFVGDVPDVIANAWQWNDAMAPDSTERALWGRRSTQFFVHDPLHGEFAPAKFCAFIPASRPGGAAPPSGLMTFPLYVELDESETRFDGNRAWRHLVGKLAFERSPLSGTLAEAFAKWHSRYGIVLRQPVTILTPPRWFTARDL